MDLLLSHSTKEELFNFFLTLCFVGAALPLALP